jgi:hypothetical protein
VLTFTDVLDLLAHELAGLRARRLPFSPVLFDSLLRPFSGIDPS